MNQILKNNIIGSSYFILGILIIKIMVNIDGTLAALGIIQNGLVILLSSYIIIFTSYIIYVYRKNDIKKDFFNYLILSLIHWVVPLSITLIWRQIWKNYISSSTSIPSKSKPTEIILLVDSIEEIKDF